MHNKKTNVTTLMLTCDVVTKFDSDESSLTVQNLHGGRVGLLGETGPGFIAG